MPRARQAAALSSLACAAVLLTACSSAASSSAPPAARTTSAGSTVSTAGAPATSGSPDLPSALPGTASAAPTVTPAPAGTATFLAASQDLTGTLLHEPACGGYGCALSGDSTAILSGMTWTTWSGAEAVGTGTYKLDDCTPNCAAATVYPVVAVVTLSQPVKVCSAAGIRWVWSRASFTFPHGLPKALQGQNAPQNPWTFSSLIATARQSCS